MAEATLELPRAMVQRVQDGNRHSEVKQGRIVDDLSDPKFSMTNFEGSLADVNRRLDRLKMRVERMARRPEPTDAPQT